MPALASLLRTTLRRTADLAAVGSLALDTAAGGLRGLAGESGDESLAPRPRADAAPTAGAAAAPAPASTDDDRGPSEAEAHQPSAAPAPGRTPAEPREPAAGTRTRISNPKAARKVRARENAQPS
ncbi:MAG: hypothetical protein ACR2NB_10040 [Solirubrobacteraceae bacterium]